MGGEAVRVEAVVLAAGYSSRAKAFKPLLDIMGRTVLERCLDGMAGVCGHIIVVGGFQIERLAEVVAQYENARLIENPEYPKGMFSSVLAGARETSGGRVFIVPGDHPLIGQGVYEALLRADGDIVLPAYKGATGHPALLSTRMIKELLKEPLSSTLRDFIERHSPVLVEVDDDAILTDLDTPEDYERILELLGRREGSHD